MRNLETASNDEVGSEEIIERLDRIETLLSGTDPEPLSFTEAADYLDLSKSWLYKLTARNAIPHYKPFGKKIYFLKTELDNFIRNGERD